MTDHLTANDIVHMNERCIRAYGGTFTPPENLSDEEVLNKVVEEAAAEQLQKPASKAAFYFHAIITRKAFLDANESTALLASRTFILLNGGSFHKKLKVVAQNEQQIPENAAGNQQIWLRLVAQTSSGALSLENLEEWFSRNTTVPKI
ncbi:hypothetical protein FUA23_05865 [Neolewinella aurantiaca]|uniref:Fido domain-containing protein n=1 Tax=Neolewinella aurantiaca TaxID=2602767 RepID=A0A5C7FVH6_9BACT|nr:hypothetical protein [Neolewinella aurantiaca]TXF90619.1 hypothetical protein FUA23_05865 [Neolewinella aurantiaca]